MGGWVSVCVCDCVCVCVCVGDSRGDSDYLDTTTDALPICASTQHKHTHTHTHTQVLDAVILTVSCANLCIHTPPDALPMTWAPGLLKKTQKSAYSATTESKDATRLRFQKG